MGRRSAWLLANGSKRWGEAFFLLYTPFWLSLCLGGIVPFKFFKVLLRLIILCSSRASRLILGWLLASSSTGFSIGDRLG